MSLDCPNCNTPGLEFPDRTALEAKCGRCGWFGYALSHYTLEQVEKARRRRRPPEEQGSKLEKLPPFKFRRYASILTSED